MILPRIKNYQKHEGYFWGNIIFEKNCKISMWASQLAVIFKPSASLGTTGQANILLSEQNFSKVGSYKLNVTPSRITILYGDLEGVRNAIATLCQLDNGEAIPCCEIFDEPDNDFRSCMLDLARGYVEIDVLKEHIVRMALLKYNHIHLHLMDRQSYVLQSDVVPNPVGYKQYTKQEMSDLADFCKLLELEVIPEIEIPAHAVNQIKALPALACDIIDRKKAVDLIRKAEDPRKREFTNNKLGVSSWVVCAGKESTYEIYEKIVAEICEIFNGKYLHIGGDELAFRNLGAHPHWENCVHCKKQMEEENIKTVRELYYYVIKRMYDIVTRFGKKMMVWNDQLDALNPIDIPKDIIVEYWNGGVITKEKEILQKLCDQEFEVINAHYRYAYADHPRYMQEGNIKEWNTKTDILGESEVIGAILGGEMCVWELGNPLYSFYSCSLPVCMTLFADRLWNHGAVEYDEAYKISVFSEMIGKKMKLHPFNFFNEMIPPRDCARTMPEGIDFEHIDKALLEDMLSELKNTDPNNIYGKFARESYIEFLETIQYCIC